MIRPSKQLLPYLQGFGATIALGRGPAEPLLNHSTWTEATARKAILNDR